VVVLDLLLSITKTVVTIPPETVQVSEAMGGQPTIVKSGINMGIS
jgi:hypothetical protein